MSSNENHRKSLTHRFLETFSATFTYALIAHSWLVANIILYFIMYTKFWWIMIMYLGWIWVLDVGISEKGGRSIEFLRSSKIWKYARSYFPLDVVPVPGFELDATKNYLLCCHPHGLIPGGALLTACSNGNGHWKFSNHKFYSFGIKLLFKIPFARDILLACGLCEASAKSITYIISNPSGGNVGVLFPGGAAEASYSNPGCYEILIKTRKGFIKLALMNGCAIIPSFSFGEVDVFDQVQNSLLRWLQNLVKSATGVFPSVFYGRGYLHIPYRAPITIVVDLPIYVSKIEKPSQDEINNLHEEYVLRVSKVFEEYKHQYITNANCRKLIIN